MAAFAVAANPCRSQSGESRGPAEQPFRKQRTAPRQPGRDRSFRPAELLGRLPARLALKLAQHKRQAVLLRQPRQLLIEQGQPIVSFLRRRHLGPGQRFLLLAPVSGGSTRLQGGALSHAVQPVTQDGP